MGTHLLHSAFLTSLLPGDQTGLVDPLRSLYASHVCSLFVLLPGENSDVMRVSMCWVDEWLSDFTGLNQSFSSSLSVLREKKHHFSPKAIMFGIVSLMVSHGPV